LDIAVVGHCVTGLIAKSTILDAFSRGHSLHQPVALVGEFAILPLRDIDLDSFLVAPLCFDIEGFRYPADQLLDELRLASRQGMLMYFETDYFSGWAVKARQSSNTVSLYLGPSQRRLELSIKASSSLAYVSSRRRKTSSKQSGLAVIAIQRDGLNIRNIGSSTRISSKVRSWDPARRNILVGPQQATRGTGAAPCFWCVVLKSACTLPLSTAEELSYDHPTRRLQLWAASPHDRRRIGAHLHVSLSVVPAPYWCSI
jgi:hypothetical protein